MSSFHLPILVAHVIVAVLGAGAVTSVAIVSGSARRAGRAPADALLSIRPLLRWSAVGLLAILVTGILLGIAAGPLHQAGWFRASVLLLVPMGILHARSRRVLRRGLTGEHERGLALRRIEGDSWAMSAIIAFIVVLMEAKPL